MAIVDLLKPAAGLRVMGTGGAAGIGLSIAKGFDEVGARVYVCDVDPAAVAAVTAAHPSIGAGVANVAERASVDRVIAARAQAVGLGFDAMKAAYLAKISLGRMVTESDIAAMALFLCSPAARKITGQSISVDGNVEHL